MARQGGDITLGAEGEPDCMDWIASCAGVPWGIYTVQTNTMPRAYDSTDGGYRPSVLLNGAATVVTAPRQVVTYRIEPAAVWSDGQPITSHDFQYTWDQIAHGNDIYTATGYRQISGVDDRDPHAAVVTFSSPYPEWRTLFGGIFGIYPSHLLEGRDRHAMMVNGYAFSGGPWRLDHWTKGREIKLVRNDNFWGKRPNLDSVTFTLITDPVAEQRDYRTGVILAEYPAPQPGTDLPRGTPGTYVDAISGLSYEAAWLNVEKAPFDTAAVRQALAFATDRDVLAQQLLGAVQPDIKPIQSLATPAFGAAYTTPFSRYTLNLQAVESLMIGAGWQKGRDGIWAKDGVTATVELKTTSNRGRQMTGRILQAQWHAAGFQLVITPESSQSLISDLSAGNFQLALYSQTPAGDDPSGCFLWCSKNIPVGPAHSPGLNWDRINDPALDKVWIDADSNLDNTARMSDIRQGQATLAEDMPALPLVALPDVIVVNSDKVATQQGSFQHNVAYGPFTYLNYWFLK